MVNHLRLTELAAPAGPAGGPAPASALPVAAASFGVLTALFLVALGLQVFGDPLGGLPRVSLALSGVPDTGDAAGPPMVLDQTAAAVPALPDDATVEIVEVDGNASVATSEPESADNTVQIAMRTALRPAPVAAVQGQSDQGPVPVIGPNGERPADVYARPYSNPDNLPMVALVIGGLGINADATQTAIDTLPGEVTLSFVPYADDLQHWIDLARAAGHEVIIELPLEPFDYPNNDPGPATLLTSSAPEDNQTRLEWVMSRASGYVGLMNYQGARLTASERSYAPVLSDIASRGLLYLDDGTSPRSLTRRLSPGAGGEWAVADRRIDLRRNGAAINNALSHLEQSATESGVAIGVGFAYPVTVEAITAWADSLELKGLSLAPLSAATTSETGN